ncbi:Ion transport protein-domain-containing protein [Pavlovales sp. CCMP2436]|nr:Ion transport protein-domain-containing protein [Pavlovales sp. CCMP2436]
MRNPGVTPPAEGAARADAALAEPPRAVAAQVGQSLTLGSTAAQLQKNAAAAAADPGVSERGLAYSTISFGLTQHHPLRLFTIRLVENAWFDRVVLVFILANCLTIAISGPGAVRAILQCQVRERAHHPSASSPAQHPYLFAPRPPSPTQNSPTDNALEILFTSVFTAEILLRALAYGLVQTKNSYLRDRWHWLDIVVVVTSWISISVADSSTNYGALRTFRVLRPLRTVNSVRGMRVLVLSMLRSIPKLLDVAIVAVFVALVFAILGVQSFKGALHYRCVPDDSPLLNAALSNDDLVRQLGESASDRAVCDPLRASSCAFEGHACVYFEQNPNYGLTSFDDVWHASLVIFISSTLEGWSDIMYMAGAGADEWLSVVYFLLLIVLGSFFVVNLFLAVIFESFQEATAEDKRAVREQKDAELHAAKLRRLTRSSSSGSTMAVGSAAASGVGGVGAAAGGHGSPLRREGSCSALEAGSQSSSSLLSSEEEEKLTEEEARAALYAADGGDDEKDAPAHMGQVAALTATNS